MQQDNQRWRILEVAVARSHPRRIIEVGLMRADTEAHRLGDGHSTRFWAEYIEMVPDAEYLGIDLDGETVKLCQGLFSDLPRMRFVQGDAKELMNRLGEVDFLYLDGGNDPAETIRQVLPVFDSIQTVVVDDTCIHHINDCPYWIGKGAALLPMLEAHGWEIVSPEDYMAIAFRGGA